MHRIHSLARAFVLPSAFLLAALGAHGQANAASAECMSDLGSSCQIDNNFGDSVVCDCADGGGDGGGGGELWAGLDDAALQALCMPILLDFCGETLPPEELFCENEFGQCLISNDPDSIWCECIDLSEGGGGGGNAWVDFTDEQLLVQCNAELSFCDGAEGATGGATSDSGWSGESGASGESTGGGTDATGDTGGANSSGSYDTGGDTAGDGTAGPHDTGSYDTGRDTGSSGSTTGGGTTGNASAGGGTTGVATTTGNEAGNDTTATGTGGAETGGDSGGSRKGGGCSVGGRSSIGALFILGLLGLTRRRRDVASNQG